MTKAEHAVDAIEALLATAVQTNGLAPLEAARVSTLGAFFVERFDRAVLALEESARVSSVIAKQLERLAHTHGAPENF